ncbi:phosphotransferase family protein [Tropicimonas marinistellae]|uniref:phosphotransferase family protein n=1 Tax=Tropicimonas marinistellae TaxID=1739787 RepID=UPI001372400F|nr:phosphotransferase [Tropicimonas marinistellae]
MNEQHFIAFSELRSFTSHCVSTRHMPEDHSFFVMDWIDAPTLNRRLRPAELKRQKALTMAGAWLSRLQKTSLERAIPASSAHFRIRPPHVYRGIVGTVAKRLRRRVRALSPLTGPVVLLHGDFHPGNVFVKGTKLLAFDRLFNKHGIAYFDAAWFLCHLALMRERALEKERPWSGDHEADRRYFFQGYGAIGEKELPTFDLVEDIALIKMWQSRIVAGNQRANGLVRSYGLLEGAARK